ncbi:MAG: dihydroorotate dehydrogenase (quinone), partial [Gallionella sp.]
MMYSLLRPALFKLSPETAHHATLTGLNAAYSLGLSSLLAPRIANDAHTVMGINFPNPVGLAAGLDKNGDCINGLAALGFGSIEIGTITPLAQAGNPQPRLFRLPKAAAIINRMGFNNDGVDKLIANVQAANFKGVLGINIGKNAATPIANAADDYLICLRKVYAHASYITVNISSPNTKNLRQLQNDEALDKLLATLKAEQEKLA